MTAFDEVIRSLEQWFMVNNLETRSLTLILNFRDVPEAGAFDWRLHHELNERHLIKFSSDHHHLQEFTLYGIKIRVESPLHGIP